MGRPAATPYECSSNHHDSTVPDRALGGLEWYLRLTVSPDQESHCRAFGPGLWRFRRTCAKAVSRDAHVWNLTVFIVRADERLVARRKALSRFSSAVELRRPLEVSDLTAVLHRALIRRPECLDS
jgi:hypothetical protein